MGAVYQQTAPPCAKKRGFSGTVPFHQVMNGNGNQLRQLLPQWRGLEPRGDFESAVWRRIRLAEAAKPVRSAWWSWLPHPALATMAAVVIGLTIGITGGAFSVLPAHGLGLLAPETLAGSYVRLVQR
jgi:hypothetical protein